MANGSRPCVKCWATLGVVLAVVLVTTNVWNPFPALWASITASDPITAPAAAWQQRLGGVARSVTVTGGAVVVEYRTRVEAFGLTVGRPLWEKRADWAAVAGRDTDAVVVTGRLLTKGYEVLDAATGVVRRTDTEAVAVWTYGDALLDLRCATSRECRLTAWDPRGAQPRWVVPTTGIGFVVFADNPTLPGARPLAGPRIADDVAGPGSLPALIALPHDGRLALVDTAAGRLLRTVTPDRSRRVTVAGGRLLDVTAEARDGTCYFAVTAGDAASGRPIWRADGLNLRTVADAGCRQTRDPSGGEHILLGVGADGRERLVDARDGRRLWRGAAGERVLAVDDERAVIRGADGRGMTVRPFARDRERWRRTVSPITQAALSPYAAVLVDPAARRVTALHPGSGAVLAEVRTGGRVVAVGRNGLVLAAGRDLAYVPFMAGA